MTEVAHFVPEAWIANVIHHEKDIIWWHNIFEGGFFKCCYRLMISKEWKDNGYVTQRYEKVRHCFFEKKGKQHYEMM